MSLALDLLEQAHHLSIRESRRPKQASLRRAVSTAYYALFHLLTAEAALQIAPVADLGVRAELQRLFDHGQMKSTCSFFSGFRLAAPADRFHPTELFSELREVARAFVQLQQRRHSADYDVATPWTRIQAEQSVQLARGAFAAWRIVRGTPEASIFLYALQDLKKLQTQRP